MEAVLLLSERHIRDWANTRDAEGMLPLLVRRLIGRTATVTALAMPGGDAISSPGWDGDVGAEGGNAWVPAGRSCWEMGRDRVPATKAAKDYQKRTEQTPADIRRNTTFVFVTPRRWDGKSEWRDATEAKAEWRAIRVFDSRDLENWLEESPAVALWFADLLGIAGPGVETPDATWRRWADQTIPSITVSAFLNGRTEFADLLVDSLRSDTTQAVVSADSRDEAVAFAVAVTLGDEALRSRTVVVTDAAGWRYVDANPDIAIAIVAGEDAARSASPKRGRLLLIPQAAGGILAAPERASKMRLPRPERRAFHEALTSLGLDAADAERAARHCGRSWSVWRRLNAMNPAIRQPPWLNRAEARVLSTVCLVGAWRADYETDRAIVAEIAGRGYSEVEADLLALAGEDDPPVLRIGTAWKAKAPLELLHLWGTRLKGEDIDRFLLCLRRILESADPVLELEPEKRWMAAVYGKVRAESGALIESLLDSMTKLAVRGVDVPSLGPLHLEARIARLVGDVLHGAERTRWLSVSSFLCELAEAAPDAFMNAVDTALRSPDSPVTALIAESGSADVGMTGRCWHADLLWALERLAWAPQRLGRVADLLARLTHAPVPRNWGNTPERSLRSLFVFWQPQTNAPAAMRLQVLDRVVHGHQDIGWKLLTGLGLRESSFGNYSATPAWRDDDAGRIERPDEQEQWQIIQHVHERLVSLALGNAKRVGELIAQIRCLNPTDQKRVWDLAEEFSADRYSDEERETLCSSLRGILHWHLNHGKGEAGALAEFLQRPTALLARLQPSNLVVRHRWLFASSWVDLPEANASRLESSRRTELQRQALAEVLSDGGWDDVDDLIHTCGEPWIVGHSLVHLDLSETALTAWSLERLPSCPTDRPMQLAVAGALHTLPDERRSSISGKCLESLAARDNAGAEIQALLLALPFNRETWGLADSLGAAVAQSYWNSIPSTWCREEDDTITASERLLAVGRPCAAFQVMRSMRKSAPTDLLLRVMSAALQTTEPAEVIKQLDHYSLAEALSLLAEDISIEDDEVIRLEFGFGLVDRWHGKSNQRIYKRLARDPSFFVELLRIVYRSDHGDDPRGSDNPQLWERAYEVLEHWHWVPGTLEDGRIDKVQLDEWIDGALALSNQVGRVEPAQRVIGSILAYAPSESDGIWPCVSVRDALDHPDRHEMRCGLHTGLFNKRGVTSRAADEGGEQERALAARYRGWADALASTHWRLAEVLTSLADGYERDAQRQDARAAWSCENFG